MLTKSVTLIKLGGAIITNKEIPNQLREDVLTRLVTEIGEARKQMKGYLVIGNGSGSYSHVPAARYKTMEGFINSESRIGMAITQDSAARINREVVKAFIQQDLPAVTLAPSNSLVTKNREADSYFTDVFEQYLELGLIPITHGDVVVDRTQGCTIWSTDKVFTFFARQFQQRGWHVNQIIHVTEAEGVWPMKNGKPETNNGQQVIYPLITPSMTDEVKAAMVDTKGFDVTGGMWHKIQESLSLTELGITTKIISGLKPGALYQTLLGDQSEGTTIAPENVYEKSIPTSSQTHRDHSRWQSAMGASA